MSARVFKPGDEAAMVALGGALARGLRPGLLVYLEGELGAGKTTLARGVIQGLGHEGAVKSPTYTLVEPYEHTRIPVCHCDLYRVNDSEELENIGLRDLLTPDRLCLVEWPQRGAGFLPPADLIITIVPSGTGREVNVRASGGAAGDVFAAFSDDR